MTPLAKAKARHYKRQQREKQRRWLKKYHGVSTAEALVSKLMKESN